MGDVYLGSRWDKAGALGFAAFLGFCCLRPPSVPAFRSFDYGVATSYNIRKGKTALRNPKLRPTYGGGTAIGQLWGRIRTSENDIFLQIPV